MKNLIQKLKNYLGKGKYTTNEEAAAIIRRFVNGSSGDPYEWDDFETQNEENPAAEIALELCWYFANRYPAGSRTEYCDQKAVPFFLKIADALEENAFAGLNFEVIKESLKKGILPENIREILKL